MYSVFVVVIVLPFWVLEGYAQESDRFSLEDFATIEKIDIHFHLHTENADFVTLARRDRFSFLNIATQSAGPDVMEQKHKTMFLQYRTNPDRIAPVSSFSMEGWDDPDWQQQTIRSLDGTFAKGAVGVKVWKNIGMVTRDKNGKLVMIDDPKLDPIFDHLEERGIVLMGHLGEPKNCWLPLEEMTVNNDRSYFQRNPQYHMYLHPQMPSYQDQIDARDRMLAKHPNLPFLAAHLASLEWSVDELAKFLDRFPNAVVGVAARLGQLQYQSQQDRAKVIRFLNKYQDRVLYGSDTGVGPTSAIQQRYQQTRERWLRDWEYFNSDELIEVPELNDPVQGLALSKQVVEKIYRINAENLFPKSWGQSGR
jgi:predicted TIM-barrel fold metal-dependent hydrolase